MHVVKQLLEWMTGQVLKPEFNAVQPIYSVPEMHILEVKVRRGMQWAVKVVACKAATLLSCLQAVKAKLIETSEKSCGRLLSY